MHQKYWLDPLNDAQLLASVLSELAAPGSRVAIEGGADLLELAKLPGAIMGPLAPFRQNVQGPGSTMIILPLTGQEQARALSERLTKGERVAPEIDAVQVERRGSVEFLAADSFHRECISVGPGLSDSFWEGLMRQGTIRGFYAPDKAREHFGPPRRDA